MARSSIQETSRLNGADSRAVLVFAAELGEELIHKIIRHFRHGALSLYLPSSFPLSLSLYRYLSFILKHGRRARRALGYLMYDPRVFCFLHQDAPKREISYPINFSWPHFTPFGPSSFSRQDDQARATFCILSPSVVDE